jgi:hypothetical protein
MTAKLAVCATAALFLGGVFPSCFCDPLLTVILFSFSPGPKYFSRQAGRTCRLTVLGKAPAADRIRRFEKGEKTIFVT